MMSINAVKGVEIGDGFAAAMHDDDWISCVVLNDFGNLVSTAFVVDTRDACVVAISAPILNEGKFQGVVGRIVIGHHNLHIRQLAVLDQRGEKLFQVSLPVPVEDDYGELLHSASMIFSMVR